MCFRTVRLLRIVSIIYLTFRVNGGYGLLEFGTVAEHILSTKSAFRWGTHHEPSVSRCDYTSSNSIFQPVRFFGWSKCNKIFFKSNRIHLSIHKRFVNVMKPSNRFVISIRGRLKTP